MKEQFLVIGVLLLSAVAGASVAIGHHIYFPPITNSNYEVISGIITSFNKEKDTVSILVNSPSQEKITIQITPYTNLYPFVFKEENDIFTNTIIYPSVFSKKSDLKKNTWVSALIYNNDKKETIGVLLYYVIEPQNIPSF